MFELYASDIRRHYIAVACRLQPRSDTASWLATLKIASQRAICQFAPH